jgi:hypothetical protein
MLCLQNGKFDAPDRLFHSIRETWVNVLTNPGDVKEARYPHRRTHAPETLTHTHREKRLLIHTHTHTHKHAHPPTHPHPHTHTHERTRCMDVRVREG